jgi:hypothetical protein
LQTGFHGRITRFNASFRSKLRNVPRQPGERPQSPSGRDARTSRWGIGGECARA